MSKDNTCLTCKGTGHKFPDAPRSCIDCHGSGQQEDKPRDYEAEAAEIKKLHEGQPHDYQCSWCGKRPPITNKGEK